MRTLLHDVRLVQDGKVERGSLVLQDGRIREWLPLGGSGLSEGMHLSGGNGLSEGMHFSGESGLAGGMHLSEGSGSPMEMRLSAGGLAGDTDACTFLDCRGLYLSHGFIDIHVHGGGGHDFMDGTREAWDGAGRLHLTHGTTGIVATTMASTPEEMEGAARLWELSKGEAGGARLLGLHMEGPYLALGQSGAQDGAYIRNPAPEEYRRLVQMCPGILRWTVAPELPGALEMGDYLSSQGILPSIGHSDAVYDQVKEALEHGYAHVTHLYSAMSSITRVQGFRRAGIIESAYLLPGLTSEVIADGCHLPGELLAMAYRFIGPERLALVTDAMRAAGQGFGESVLGSLARGQRVLVEDGVAKMPDRRAFAGSVCTADRLVKNMVRLAGATLPDAVKMATETPARIIGLQDKAGRVEPGRRADLVLFDEEISVKLVMVDGEIRYVEDGFHA